MSKVFEAYSQALRDFSARIVQVSQEMNDNRTKFNSVVSKFQDAVLAEEPTEALQKEMDALQNAYQTIVYKSEALNRVNDRGKNSAVKKAARAVHATNTELILQMREQYEEKKQALLAMQAEYLKELLALGQLARESAMLRSEIGEASADSGLGVHIQNVGSELEGLLSQRRGWIFPNLDNIARAYVSGTLPPDKSFQGIVTGKPKEKILTAEAVPAPPRVPNHPAQPVKPEQPAKPAQPQK